jgi:hypothetical protein
MEEHFSVSIGMPFQEQKCNDSKVVDRKIRSDLLRASGESGSKVAEPAGKTDPRSKNATILLQVYLGTLCRYQ